MPRASNSVFAAWLAIATALAAPGFAAAPQIEKQQEKKEPPQEPESPPAVVPAEAVKFAAALKDAAPAAFRRWAASYVKKELRDIPAEAEAVGAAVKRRFPAASETARGAGELILYDLAYRAAEELQKIHAEEIRLLDREHTDITRDLEILEPYRRLGGASPANSPRTGQPRMQRELELENRLQQLEADKQVRSTQLALAEKKANHYLNLLAARYEKLKGTNPAVLRELK